MKTISFSRFGRKSLLALALAAVVGGAVAAPAMADERWDRGNQASHQRYEDWRHREWRRHEVRDYRYHDYRYHDGRYYAYAAPTYRTPSLNLVFPFDIR